MGISVLSVDWRQTIHIILYICYMLVLIGVVITILMENRNPVKALSYILVMIFVPVVGLAVYYFLGRDWRKRKMFNMKGLDSQLQQQQFLSVQEEVTRVREEVGVLSEQNHPLPRLFFNTNQSLLTRQNKVTLLVNGEAKFPVLYEALEAARHHIHLEYYIFTQDDVGMKIQEILLEKLAQGVEVRLIYDHSGSNRIKKIPEILRAHGAEVYTFGAVRFETLGSANYRDHRKIVVIDGQVGFVGGINVDDRYWNNGKHSLFWRDTHVKIEGKAVNLLQLQFLLSYKYVSKKTFPLQDPYFRSDFKSFPHEDCPMDIVGSGPDSRYPWNMDGILLAINHARTRVRLTTPYFIPSDEVMKALKIAAESGKTVELLLPEKGDSKIVQHAAYSYLGELLEAGVSVYLYRKGFVHAKTMTVDEDMAMVGTVNIDNRSFYFNFEIAAYIYKQDFVNQLNDVFDQDLLHTSLLTYEAWKSRSFGLRLVDAVCRLISPLL